MKPRTLILIYLLPCFFTLLSGSTRIPFPDKIPIEHFSYFKYPTDVLGFMDSREGAEITPEGYIYTGYTELIFLQCEDLTYFPLREHYWLEREYLPIHHWIHQTRGTQYKFTAFAAPIDMDPEKNLIVFLKVRITNPTQTKKHSMFAISTRYLPLESEGNGSYSPARHRFRRPAEPKVTGMYQQEGEQFSRKWRYMFQDNQFLRDGKILYTFTSKNEPVLFSYRGYKIEPEVTFRQPLIASSPVGIACFSKKLNPGEYFEITIKMPYTPVALSSAEQQQLAHLDFTQMKERTISFWEKILSKGMQIELTEEKPVHVYKTSLIYDLIARDKIGEYYAQKVNEFNYDAFWLRDSAYFVRSYDLGGYFNIAKQSLEFFFRWQKENGNFLSQGGQYDGWGQALWALGQHFRLTRDKNFAEKSLKAIMDAAQWLKLEMEKDPLGIMPQSTPGDNENIKGGHVTGHNFWALAGLKNAILLAEGLDKKEEASQLSSIYTRLNRNFQKTLKKVLKKTHNYIPPGLDKEGGQDWGNLMAVYPEEILDPFHAAVTETLKRSKGKYREKIMTYGDTQYLHHYLTMKNTETLIIRGAQQEVLEEFYAILAHTSSTQAGFEFSINPWSNRDFRANLTPHGWFAAKYRNMLRNMLIRERGNTLHLLSVISPEWVIPGKHILVKKAPTYYGQVSFTALFREEGMELRIKPSFFHPPEKIALHIPYFFTFKNSNKGKVSNNIIFLSPQEDNVSVTWVKNPKAPGFSYQKAVSWLKEEYKK